MNKLNLLRPGNKKNTSINLNVFKISLNSIRDNQSQPSENKSSNQSFMSKFSDNLKIKKMERNQRNDKGLFNEIYHVYDIDNDDSMESF